ncbi:hypothetical protein XENOCAPTIV_024192, partial [Xenoophorus captivus]
DGDQIFNRAKLLNVGYMEALKEYDYNCFVFSDVDLIPMDDRNTYRCFSQPRHLSVSMDKFGFRSLIIKDLNVWSCLQARFCMHHRRVLWSISQPAGGRKEALSLCLCSVSLTRQKLQIG